MLNRLKILAAFLCAMLTINLSAVRAFRIIEETPEYLKISFTLPEWSIEEVSANNQKWHQIKCDEGTVLAKEGYPILMAFSDAIGIPLDGDISISVVSQKTEKNQNIKLLPADKSEIDGMDIKQVFYQNFNAYSNNSLYPALLVQKGDAAFIGNRNMVPLKIYPFQYSAGTKELTITTEAILMIHISGNKTSQRDWQQSYNYIDEVGDSFFLNNNTAKFWRKPKEQMSYTPYGRTDPNQVSELQFVIDKEGIYKITYQYLYDKMTEYADSLGIQYSWSLDTIDPRNLQLSDEFGPVAIHFNGESDGVFNPSDYFEFYGDRHYGDYGYQDDYTAENVYVLTLIDGLGARLAVENGGLIESNSANYIEPDAYQHSIHLEQQLIPDKLGRSWSSNSNYYREDLWFWKKITAPNLEIIPFELQYPKDTTTRTLSTKISLFGLTYIQSLPDDEYDHRASIRLNQSLVATEEWRDQSEQIFVNETPLPNSYLTNGTNYYYISMNGDTPLGDREQVLLDYIELTYWREYKTSEDFIKFSKPSNRPFGLYQFKVEGFSSNQISLYKIGSSIFNNMQIEPFSLNGAEPWTITFQDSVISNDVKYFALTEDQKRIPKDFRINLPSFLKANDNAADFIIITKRDFIQDNGTEQYVQLWENAGYQVEVIDVQDIYDEFNFGIRSAESIKDFLTYAYNNWSEPQIRSVLLLGDGTDDERDNSVSRKYNIVPVKKIWTFQHGATASDNWYGCVVGDDPIPDISVSRINVWLRSQIIDVVNKSLTYMNQPAFNEMWHGHLILATGGKQQDGNDEFSRQSETIRRLRIPNYYRASRVYTNTMTVSSDFRGNTIDLMNFINEGAIYLQFMGHGGGRIWADYNLFNFSNVASLNNSIYPIVTSLACYCSAFDTNGASSISEAMVLQPEKGAIATIGFSGLGYLYDNLVFGLALTEGLFMHDFDTLGDAMNFTKAKFYVTVSQFNAQQALTQGCVLLGDPLIKVIKPKNKVVVSTDKDTYAVGDTINVSATFLEPTSAARTFILKTTELTMNPPNLSPVVDNSYNYSYVLTGNSSDQYNRKVYVTAFSDQDEYYGYKNVSIGRPLVTHLSTIPELPQYTDSIYFRVKVNGIANITGVYCRARLDSLSATPQWIVLPMVRTSADSTVYQSTQGLPPQVTGKEFYFKYRVISSDKAVAESFLYPLVVAGPELLMQDVDFITQNNNLCVKTLIKNTGNGPSGNTVVKLIAYQAGIPAIILNSQVFTPLDPEENRWVILPIDTLLVNNVIFEANVNIPRMFPEWSSDDDNNKLIINIPMNYHIMDSSGGVLTSLDSNVICEVPAGLVPVNETSMFYINVLSEVDPKDQPDISPIKLLSGDNSLPYEIKTLDSGIVDSTGILINGKKLKLTFFYNITDTQTQELESENSFKIYRWEPDFRKWILQGGNISVTEDKVVFEVNRQGIYSLLRNSDRIRPSIDVNVQDQEFTVGGYISGKGTISLLLSDANGIDVFDNSIKLFLDGIEIPESQWVHTINLDNINRIPIKYQLNLQRGNYTLVVDCKDVNGNFNTRDIQFVVNDRFDVIRLANYPNPVLGKTEDPKNTGRTRFTYVLTDDAEEVNIKVYTVSGRLVRTFKNLPTGVGYHEFPRTVYAWDCTDEQGFYLANGVYFYRISARQGNKTIEKIQKMAILK
jgi:hypothetical protein